jgi:hypothetical protein
MDVLFTGWNVECKEYFLNFFSVYCQQEYVCASNGIRNPDQIFGPGQDDLLTEAGDIDGLDTERNEPKTSFYLGNRSFAVGRLLACQSGSRI